MSTPSRYRTTFSQRTEDQLTHVVIGRDIAVPTGLWRQIDDHRAEERIVGVPRITSRSVSWLIYSKWRDVISVEHRVDTRRASHFPFATPLDAWSHAAHFARRRESWTIEAVGDAGLLRGGSERLIYWIQKQPACVAQEAREVLVMLGAPERFLASLDASLAIAAERVSARAATAAEKAALTRGLPKERGGNPKRWVEGDLLVALKKIHFQNGSAQQVFRWARSAANVHGPAKCYAILDAKGFGVGSAYRVPRKDLRRVCPAAFDEVEGLSAHERAGLLRHQRAIESARKETQARSEEDQSSDGPVC